jgi:hypothetical protein
MVAVAAAALLLLIGWGGYAVLQDIIQTKEDALQQREAELNAWQAKAAADAEANRKADEAERQRLAAVKAEQEHQASFESSALPIGPSTITAPNSLFTIQRDVEASPTGGTRNESLYSRSIEECEQTCAQRPTCNVFTYAKGIGAGACYLYTRAELKPNAGFDSGIRK